MENKMFCFQCEQTAGCTACTGTQGVCGKKADTAKLQDEPTGALIGQQEQQKEFANISAPILFTTNCLMPSKESCYYTEFVKQTPKDSIVLTLACGKYRFNDIDLSHIEGFPRMRIFQESVVLIYIISVKPFLNDNILTRRDIGAIMRRTNQN